jgi:hypothetical protein
MTAKEAGLKKGMKGEHEDYGLCEIVRISGDGTSLTLMDEAGDTHKGIACGEIEVEKKKTTKKKPTKKTTKKKPPVKEEDDEEEDDWEEWDEEED